MHSEFHQEMLNASIILGVSAAPSRCLDAGATSRVCGEIAFRRFRVRPWARQVLRDGHPVDIGSRAFDLLMVLLASRGAVVSKAHIFRTVWPSAVVHEGNLRFQMTSLRKLLGQDRDVIKTIPGRGYLFIAEEPAHDEGEPGALRLDSFISQLRPSSEPDPSALRVDPLIIVIDDRRGARSEIAEGLRSAGFRVEAYRSVEDFRESGCASTASCLVLDACQRSAVPRSFQASLFDRGTDHGTPFGRPVECEPI